MIWYPRDLVQQLMDGETLCATVQLYRDGWTVNVQGAVVAEKVPTLWQAQFIAEGKVRELRKEWER